MSDHTAMFPDSCGDLSGSLRTKVAAGRRRPVLIKIPNGRPTRPPMPRATLAAERPSYLQLVTREDHERDVTKAVEALDKRLGEPGPSPYSSPVQVGVWQKFAEPYFGQHIAWRMLTVGGEPIVCIAPSKVGDFPDVEDAARAFADAVLAGLEAIRTP